MIGSLRSLSNLSRENWLYGGVYVTLLTVGTQLRFFQAWHYVFPLMAAVALFCWAIFHRRLRQVDDLPTSKIASAAQGYIELRGITAAMPGSELRSPHRRLPCCWYRHERYRRGSNNKWILESSDESPDYFRLQDGTGECVIDPAGAVVVGARADTYYMGRERHIEWTIVAGTPLYAIGHFRTEAGLPDDDARQHAIWKALDGLKRDKPRLAGFDINRDGEVDMAEWDFARRAVIREVDERRMSAQAPVTVNILSGPEDGRLFMLSPKSPDDLRRSLMLGCGAHLAVLACASLAALQVWFRIF